MSIYHELYPKKHLNYSEACKALKEKGLHIAHGVEGCFYLNDSEVTKLQLEELEGSFWIRTCDTEALARRIHERVLAEQMDDIKCTEEYMDKWSELVEEYREGAFDKFVLSQLLKDFCLEAFSGSAEAIEFEFRNLEEAKNAATEKE